MRRRLFHAISILLLLATPAWADLKQARSLLDTGQLEAAREAYTEVLRDGDNREAFYQLALLSNSGHDYVRYLAQFLDAGGRRDRRASEVEIRLGRFHYTSGDYRAALDFFEAARERSGDAPLRVEARYWLGRTLLALRETNEARRAFEAVIRDKAGAAWKNRAIQSLGEVLRVSGDPAGAARAFAQLRTDPDLGAAAMLAEAQCHEKAGDKREAAALYADLLRLRPTSSEAAMAREWTRAMGVVARAGKRDGEKPPVVAGEQVVAGSLGDAAPEEVRSNSGRSSATVPSHHAAAGAAAWRVQVGAFSSVENARKLVMDLERRGFPEVMAERGSDADSLYHVRFGRYADRAAADRAGLDVSALLGLRYSLVEP